MDTWTTYEDACKHAGEMMETLKERLEYVSKTLEQTECLYAKGRTKVCRPDAAGRKKRCRVGIKYQWKAELSTAGAEQIWDVFQRFFAETPFSHIERMANNEELGRYTFTAVDAMGDEISCDIYLPNEWNIPQICLTAFVASRYRAADDAEAS
jgi:hypothetical protein